MLVMRSLDPAPTITARAITSSVEPSTCDGRGFFTCAPGQGACYSYAVVGVFDNPNTWTWQGCCTSSTPAGDCGFLTACISGGNPATCASNDNYCLSCTGSDGCLYSNNQAMNQYKLGCAATDGSFDTSFSYNAPTPKYVYVEPTMQPQPSPLTSSAFPWPAATSVLQTSVTTPSSASLNMSGPKVSVTATESGAPIASVEPASSGHHPLSGGAIAGLGVGMIVALVLLTGAIFMLYKNYKDRKLNRRSGGTAAGGTYGNAESGAGSPRIFPWLRKKGDKGTVSASDSNMVEMMGMHGASEMEGDSVHCATTPSTSRYFAHNVNADTPNELASLPAKYPAGKDTAYSHVATSAILDESEEASPRAQRRLSTTSSASSTVSPLVSNFPVQSSSVDRRPVSDVSALSVLVPASTKSQAEEVKRKSSHLLAAATGPYLSPEQALGQGYWEAEREQLQANKDMEEGSGEVADAADKMSLAVAKPDAENDILKIIVRKV